MPARTLSSAHCSLHAQHCCTPNCNAKILTLNGEKRIVLYARTTILPGHELTYDYKFQGGDQADAIACLCGSPGCRRYL